MWERQNIFIYAVVYCKYCDFQRISSYSFADKVTYCAFCD